MSPARSDQPNQSGHPIMSGYDQLVLEAGISLPELEELQSLLQEPDHTPNSCPEGSNSNSNHRTATESSLDVDRKRKRMISNRESARRSRWRKKKVLEDLTDELNWLNATNRELCKRLGLAAYRCFEIRRENQRLWLECTSLSDTLSNLHGILIAAGAQNQLI